MTAWPLTRQQALFLRALAASSGVVKREALWDAITLSEDAAEPHVVKVIACHVRRKIRPLRIETVWGVGYRLDDTSRAAVRAVIG